jgi:outer membrane protein assembly factor BamB
LVDDLNKAVEVWTCHLPELPSPSYSGYADLVVADGRVYAYCFRPGGDLVYARRSRGGRASEPPDTVSEKGRRRSLLLADDVLLCIDAATGQLLWRRVYRAKGVNHNQFMDGSFCWSPQCTPCVADGKLYALGSMGRLYCLDAQTGRPIWESDLGPAKRLLERNFLKANPHFQQLAPSQHRDQLVSCPSLADGVVVCNNHDALISGKSYNPGLSGFDAATGRPLWDIPGIMWHYSTPVRWEHGGKQYALCAGGGQTSCVEPRTGRLLWSVGANHKGRDSTLAPIVTGDLLVSDSACYRITPQRAEIHCRLAQPAGKWPAIYRRWILTPQCRAGLACMDLDSGRVIAEAGSAAGNSYWHVAIAADGRAFHSSAAGELRMYEASGEKMRELPGTLKIAGWIAPVYVAGRLYLRRPEAVRCYDLRQGAEKPAARTPCEPSADSPLQEAREQAVAALAKAGADRSADALKTVRDWLRSEDWRRLEAAAGVAAANEAIAQAAMGDLQAACLRLVSQGRWAEAAELLDMVPGHRRELAVRLAPGLEPMLGGTDAGAVLSACGFAAALGAPARIHARRLLALYRQGDAAVSWAAARALDAAGIPDEMAQEVLAAAAGLLASGTYTQKWGALQMLERLGPRAAPAAPQVAAAAKSHHGCLQTLAWDALLAAGAPAAPTAAELLFSMGRDDPRIMDPLSEMRKEDLRLLVEAAEKLAGASGTPLPQTRTKRLMDALREKLEDENDDD